MRKTLDVVSAFLALVSTLFLFVGDMFHIRDNYKFAYLQPTVNYDDTFLDNSYNSADFMKVLVWIVLILFILLIGFLVIRIFTEKDTLYSKKYIALPITNSVLFFFVTIFMLSYAKEVGDFAEGGYYVSISANIIYYIEAALVLITLIVQLYVYFGKFPTEKKAKKSKNDLSSQLEELNELLNKNIITQEEFDQKKKQLLGL